MKLATMFSNPNDSRLILTLLAVLATPLAARADVILAGGNDRSVCPDPTYNACYIGVDGSRAGTLSNGASYSFVGLGVSSSDIGGVAFPAGGAATTPSGVLTVLTGGALTVVGPVNPSNPANSSVLVGVSAGSTGQLFVDGGTVVTPLLFVGEQDARASTGTVLVTNGGSIVANVASGPGSTTPGQTAIGIGRGPGSVGSLSVQGVGSSVAATGASVSIGRSGNGTLAVLGGATFTTAGSIYGSTADSSPSAVSMITVSGAGSSLTVGGKLLVGIATDPTTGTQLNQTPLPGSPNHGKSTLDVTAGGQVDGNVVVGGGGTLEGSGRIVGNVDTEGGLLSPGNSPGTLTVQGDYLMNGGTYLVQIAGNSPTLTDLLDVTGSATFNDATFLFSFIDGFAPTAGFTFDFVDAAQGLTATNSTFEFEGLEPGFSFTTAAARNTFAFTAQSNGIAVPEPETIALLAIGLVVTWGASQRRAGRDRRR